MKRLCIQLLSSLNPDCFEMMAGDEQTCGDYGVECTTGGWDDSRLFGH